MPRPLRTVHLVPMTDAERDATVETEIAEYADAKARAGIWSPEEAPRRARDEVLGILGPRPSDRGHEFLIGQGPSGRRVGWLWLGPVPAPGSPANARWLFQINVDPALRGQGWGRALLRAAEARLVAAGRTELGLNVFRWNTPAVSLYTTAGYEITFQDDRALEMRKRLRAR